MQSRVNLYTVGRFFVALGIAFCLIMAGSAGPANQAMADGGGLDTLTKLDTTLVSDRTVDSVADNDQLASVTGTEPGILTEWALNLFLFFWIP